MREFPFVHVNEESVMGFKFPGGEVAFCTGLWIVLAAAGIWANITTGHFPWYLTAATVTGISGLGMWFQIRPAGYVFGGINALLACLGLVALFVVGFSPRLAARIVGNLYAAWIAFQWSANGHD